MEVIILCVTITSIMAVAIFGVGLAIGREAGKRERVDKTKLREDDNRSVLPNNRVCSDGSSVFSNKRKVFIRHNDRHDMGEMGTEEMKEMLRILIQLIERIETL